MSLKFHKLTLDEKMKILPSFVTRSPYFLVCAMARIEVDRQRTQRNREYNKRLR